MIFNKIKKFGNNLTYIINSLDNYGKLQNFLFKRIDNQDMCLGKIMINLNNKSMSKRISDYEFKIFSQNGEDGIIQFLISRIPIERNIFIEFGVQDYTESNTRFLLRNNNWQGLIFDGSDQFINYVKNDNIYWKHSLNAVCAFITKENINDLILNNGINGDIGLLSIDIDGNDYWVWEKIDVINPRIVIVEYNSLFGPEAKISIPYDPEFIRTEKHYSNLYYGVSLQALNYLSIKKGYTLICSNTTGNNAFFVRNDLIKYLNDFLLSPDDIFVYSKFRESRDREGELSFLNYKEALNLIKDMPVIEVETNKEYKIREIIKE